MATQRSKKDFIGFILAAEQDRKLATRFLSEQKDLYQFFQKEGFTEIPESDCTDILTARTRLEKLSIGEVIGDIPCPPNAKY